MLGEPTSLKQENSAEVFRMEVTPKHNAHLNGNIPSPNSHRHQRPPKSARTMQPVKLVPHKTGPSRIGKVKTLAFDLPEPAVTPKYKPPQPIHEKTRPTKTKEPELPTKEELERMRKQFKSSKSKTIMWGNSNETPIMAQTDKEYPQSARTPKREKRIIADIYEPVDINDTIPAAPLISSTAGVKDYIGVPSSVTYFGDLK